MYRSLDIDLIPLDPGPEVPVGDLVFVAVVIDKLTSIGGPILIAIVLSIDDEAEHKVAAHNIIAMQADIAAFGAARANGAISEAEFNDGVVAVKNNYGRIIRDALISPDNDK